jgi:hypothetical protein
MQIAASEVIPGDRLYDSGAYHPAVAWVRVISVTREGDEVAIHTERWTSYLNARQGVAILRRNEKE